MIVKTKDGFVDLSKFEPIKNKGQWADIDVNAEGAVSITQPRGERKTPMCNEWADEFDKNRTVVRTPDEIDAYQKELDELKKKPANKDWRKYS